MTAAMTMMPMPMPNMMPMMSGMGPMMMGMNPMMGINPMMTSGMMPMMMCTMTCRMTDTGMICEMKPMAGMSSEMFMECCNSMMKMMGSGMPLMTCCGGMMMCCMPAAA
ncbi:hypothetical protein [Chelatococcus reniformis]|uniref:Uncharacterized protein n=1 Tax=Chelatococcus reniformis TaxID=1494448 RepID=A0A916UJ56_9HYPH|nr:hypothetical protein [Chelatococcus reniformis]GGC75043.1 hypothetical protein GCM10010994_36850 [Chelatococcus reniformis]